MANEYTPTWELEGYRGCQSPKYFEVSVIHEASTVYIDVSAISSEIPNLIPKIKSELTAIGLTFTHEGKSIQIKLPEEFTQLLKEKLQEEIAHTIRCTNRFCTKTLADEDTYLVWGGPTGVREKDHLLSITGCTLSKWGRVLIIILTPKD